MRHSDTSVARSVYSGSYLGTTERMGNFSFFLSFFGGLVPLLQAGVQLSSVCTHSVSYVRGLCSTNKVSALKRYVSNSYSVNRFIS